MHFSDKIRSNILFQKVLHRGEVSAINYIKIFQNDNALEIYVGKNYSEDKIMHNFLENLQQGRRYSYQISIPQSEFRREEKMYLIT